MHVNSFRNVCGPECQVLRPSLNATSQTPFLQCLASCSQHQASQPSIWTLSHQSFVIPPRPTGNSGDNTFPSITALLNTLYCRDKWIVKARPFPPHPHPQPQGQWKVKKWGKYKILVVLTTSAQNQNPRLFRLELNAPVTVKVMPSQSIYLTTLFLGQLGPQISYNQYLCTFSLQKLTTTLLESVEGRE